MENFEKILIGLVLFAVTSIIAFLFRMRQLYVAVPKLFRHAPISNEGSLCELHVYNKGNQVEEDIQVNLDPELKGELLASSSGGISLDVGCCRFQRHFVKLMIETGSFLSIREGNSAGNSSSRRGSFGTGKSLSIIRRMSQPGRSRRCASMEARPGCDVSSRLTIERNF